MARPADSQRGSTGDSILLTLDRSPSAADLDRLRAGLEEHAAAFVDKPGFRPLALFARSADGTLLGGAYALINWTWVDISLLWVAESERGRGLGSRLLRGIEAAARQRGCRHAHLETLTYQARAFYERHDYGVFASLPDYPPGHERVYLRKDLV